MAGVHAEQLLNKTHMAGDNIIQSVWMVHQLADVVRPHMQHNDVSIFRPKWSDAIEQPLDVVDPTTTYAVQVKDDMSIVARKILEDGVREDVSLKQRVTKM